MNTATPPTPAAPPAGPGGRPGASRATRIAAGVAVAVTAVVVTTVALSGRGSPPALVAAPQPPAPYSGPVTPVYVADGCLGGAGPEAGVLGNPDLSQVVLAAQKAAPITAKGAAEFTAAFYRWAGESPLPPAKAATARQILAVDATPAARKYVALPATKGTTTRIDFNDGRYNVDAFDGKRAVISWAAAGHGTRDGAEPGDVNLAGTVALVAVQGVWRLQDLPASTSLAMSDFARVVTPYAGGC